MAVETAGGAAASVAERRGLHDVEEMFREHYELVYRTAYSILNNAADAEDVLQTVFLRLVRREVPPDVRSNVRGYFYRAAVNVSLDVVRSKRRYELVADAELLDAPVDSSESQIVEQLHRRLAVALTELSPEAVHILILRYAHGYSDRQIARLLGTTRGAITVRLFRSRARLRKLMDSMGEES
jgi:RNA polymerase sigma-70 factor (ECF subfamily)